MAYYNIFALSVMGVFVFIAVFLFDHLKVCDPVLGDHGSYYVPQELTDEYRSRLLPLCDILTPNQFELGELTGLDVKTEEDAIKVNTELRVSNSCRLLLFKCHTDSTI